jgi:hypothetical protein
VAEWEEAQKKISFPEAELLISPRGFGRRETRRTCPQNHVQQPAKEPPGVTLGGLEAQVALSVRAHHAEGQNSDMDHILLPLRMTALCEEAAVVVL